MAHAHAPCPVGTPVNQRPATNGSAGWSDVRLLAPRAELRMLICGASSLIDSTRLSFLGEAIRALLVLEARTLRVGGRQGRGGAGARGIGVWS